MSWSTSASAWLLVLLATPAWAYGPDAKITCPANAVAIAAGQDIAAIVESRPPGASFCVRAGTHVPTRPIYLQAGDTLTGEYGAVVDGSRVTRDWDVGGIAVISGWNCVPACNNVTVRNLAVRSAKRYICIGVFGSSGWTIDHNEASGCAWGISFGQTDGTRVTANHTHHNTTGGYAGYRSANTLIEGNEIAYNGTQQKVAESRATIFRGNYVHHNTTQGIWYDGDNVDDIVEENRVEDNGGSGIMREISGRGTIRNNIVRRSGEHGVFISTSKDVEVAGNTLEGNFRGITYFVNCNARGGGAIGWDLANNTAHDNTVTLGATAGAWASGLGSTACSPAQLAPYLTGAKALTFSRNTYVAPSLTDRVWSWAGLKSWTEWRALGKDSDGALRRPN